MGRLFDSFGCLGYRFRTDKRNFGSPWCVFEVQFGRQLAISGHNLRRTTALQKPCWGYFSELFLASASLWYPRHIPGVQIKDLSAIPGILFKSRHNNGVVRLMYTKPLPQSTTPFLGQHVKMFGSKLQIKLLSYFSINTYVVGIHWKHLIEALLMSTTTMEK